MPVTGAAGVINNIKSFGGGFRNHARKVMGEAIDMLDDRITENMSLRDHTQAELTAMGHPYARRHGPEGMNLHDPSYQVHTQTGTLLSSKEKGVEISGIDSGSMSLMGYVGLNSQKAKHAQAVIWGTWRMIPRDALSGSLFNKSLQDKIGTHIKSNLRDLVINFRGVETHG
jgi:hypothetical protein